MIGAGNYCDGRYGAAACTGRGEIAIRAATAHSIVMYLRAGEAPADAGRRAMEELSELRDPYFSAMNCVILAPDGTHAALSSEERARYAFMDGTSAQVQEAPRIFVPVTAGPAQ